MTYFSEDVAHDGLVPLVATVLRVQLQQKLRLVRSAQLQENMTTNQSISEVNQVLPINAIKRFKGINHVLLRIANQYNFKWSE